MATGILEPRYTLHLSILPLERKCCLPDCRSVYLYPQQHTEVPHALEQSLWSWPLPLLQTGGGQHHSQKVRVAPVQVAPIGHLTTTPENSGADQGDYLGFYCTSSLHRLPLISTSSLGLHRLFTGIFSQFWRSQIKAWSSRIPTFLELLGSIPCFSQPQSCLGPSSLHRDHHSKGLHPWSFYWASCHLFKGSHGVHLETREWSLSATPAAKFSAG